MKKEENSTGRQTKSWLEPHHEHLDCAKKPSQSQEANTFGWKSPILSGEVVKNSARRLPEGWGLLSKEPKWV